MHVSCVDSRARCCTKQCQCTLGCTDTTAVVCRFRDIAASHHHLVSTSTTRLGGTCDSTSVNCEPPQSVNDVCGRKASYNWASFHGLSYWLTKLSCGCTNRKFARKLSDDRLLIWALPLYEHTVLLYYCTHSCVHSTTRHCLHRHRKKMY